MSYQEPLSQRTVALSISESPDMALFGHGPEHLVDALTAIARHLLALGAQLVYGGDLRSGGFTHVLAELVLRHRRDADLSDRRPGVTNVLAWPVFASTPREDLVRLADTLDGVADLLCLSPDGVPQHITATQGSSASGEAIRLSSESSAGAVQPLSDKEWADGLTQMREYITQHSDARILLGGRRHAFKGRMPGVAEEALLALRARRPLFVLGGFGGCTFDIASMLGLSTSETRRANAEHSDWPGRRLLSNFSAGDVGNGLTPEENNTLASTSHIDHAVALILRGLIRLQSHQHG